LLGSDTRDSRPWLNYVAAPRLGFRPAMTLSWIMRFMRSSVFSTGRFRLTSDGPYIVVDYRPFRCRPLISGRVKNPPREGFILLV